MGVFKNDHLGSLDLPSTKPIGVSDWNKGQWAGLQSGAVDWSSSSFS